MKFPTQDENTGSVDKTQFTSEMHRCVYAERMDPHYEEKHEIIDRISPSLLEDIKITIEEEIRSYPKYHHGERIHMGSQAESRNYVKGMVAGRLFERICEEEHMSGVDERERTLSYVLTDIIKDPTKYDLDIPQGSRLPDAVFLQFDKEKGVAYISGIAESKLGGLDDRGLEQIKDGEGGSRATVQRIVDEINRGLKEGNPKLIYLSQEIGLQGIEVDPIPNLFLLLPKDLVGPDISALQRRNENPKRYSDELIYVTNLLKKDERRSGSDREIIEERKRQLTDILINSKIEISNSSFGRGEIIGMAEYITDLILPEFQDELSPQRVQIALERGIGQEQLNAYSRIMSVMEQARRDGRVEEYTEWISPYLDRGSGVNLGKELRNNRNAAIFNNVTAEHIPSGISVHLTEGDNPRVKLEEVLEAHLQDWRTVLGIEKGRQLDERTKSRIADMLKQGLD